MRSTSWMQSLTSSRSPGHRTSKLMTGTYHNYVKQLDFTASGEKVSAQTIHSDKVIFRTLRRQASQSRSSTSISSKADSSNGVCEVMDSDTKLPFGMLSNSEIDIDKRVLQLTAHPKEQIVAVAASTNLFIFSGATNNGGAHSDNDCGSATRTLDAELVQM